jgi:hypothetical protein
MSDFTVNFGWPLPEHREQFLEDFLKQRLIDIDAALQGTASPPSAHVYHSAAQSIADGTAVALAFNSERWDTDAIHSTSSNNTRLTCQTAGKYEIGGMVEWASNAAGYRQLLIRPNGTATYIGRDVRNAVSGGTTEQQAFADCVLAAGDYVELVVTHNAGAPLNVTSAGSFSPEFWMKKVG